MKKDKLLSLITAFMIFATGNSYTVKAETLNKNEKTILQVTNAEKRTPREEFNWPITGKRIRLDECGVLRPRVDGVIYNILIHSLAEPGRSYGYYHAVTEEKIGVYNYDNNTFLPYSTFFRNNEEIEVYVSAIGFDLFIEEQKNPETYEKNKSKLFTVDELAKFLLSTGDPWYTGRPVELKPVDEDIPNIRQGELIEKDKTAFTIAGNSPINNVYDFSKVLDLKAVLSYTKKNSEISGDDLEIFTNRYLGVLPGNEWDIEFLEDINCKYRQRGGFDIFQFLTLGIADYAIKAFRDAEVEINGVVYYDVEKLRIAYSQIPEEYRISYDWYWKEHPKDLEEKPASNLEVKKENNVTSRIKMKILEEKF